MRLRNPETGAIIEIADEDERFYRDRGFEPATTADVAAGAPAEDRGLLGTVNAAATSTLSGLTLGLSDVGLGLGTSDAERRQIQADREANPVTSMLGQAVGGIVPAFAAPGSLLANTPAGLLAGASNRAVAAGQVAGGVGGFATATAATAAEGAVQNAGSYLADVAISDRGLTAEGLSGAIGTGALLGGGIGGGLYGLEAGTMAARRMFSKTADGGVAADDAAAAWERTQQETLEAYDTAANVARARLEEARALSEQARIAQARAASGLADARASVDPAAPPVAAPKPIDPQTEQLAPLVAEYDDARAAYDAALERALSGLRAPDVGVPGGRIDVVRPAGFPDGTPQPAGNQGLNEALDARARQIDVTAIGKRPQLPEVQPSLGQAALGETAKTATAPDAPPAAPSILPKSKPGKDGVIPELAAADDRAADYILSRVREQGVKYGDGDTFLGSLDIDWTNPTHKKTLLGLFRDGKLMLSRADLVEVMDPNLVASSKIESLGSSFHFVEDDGRKLTTAAGSRLPPLPGSAKNAGRYSGASKPAGPAGVPEYADIKARLDRSGDDWVESTVPAREIADRGYYETTAGAHTDPVRSEKARAAIREGQREPIQLIIAPSGRIQVEGGRHRLAAAVELDSPIKVKWGTGAEPSADMALRGSMPTPAPATDTLTGLLRVTKAKLDAGEDLFDMGEPARLGYAAAKAERTAGAAAAARAKYALPEETGLEGMVRAQRQAGIPTAVGSNPLAAQQISQEIEALVQRAASESDGAVRQGLIDKIDTLEGQLAKAGRRMTVVDDVAEVADKMSRLEKAGAELSEAIGDAAPPTAMGSAKALREAETLAERRAVERTTRAIDDAAESAPPTGPSRRERVATARAGKLNADADLARARIGEIEAKAGARSAAQKAKDARAAAKPAPAVKPAPVEGRLGLLANMGAVLEVANTVGIPGLPSPSSLPVIGPLLGAYLKYRALKAVAGRFAGRVPATGTAKAAALAAKTKERVASAIDTTLGLVGKAAPRARMPAVVLSAKVAQVLRERAFDDGDDDAPEDATTGQLAVVRMREVAFAATNPQSVLTKVRREMRDVEDPDLIAAVEKHQLNMFKYLADTAPKLPPFNPYAKREPQPSPAIAMQWGRRLAVAKNPELAFAALEQRSMTTEVAETIRKVFPALFRMAQDRLLERSSAIDEPVPYYQRLQNGMLFDVAIDPSLDPRIRTVLRESFDEPSAAPLGPEASPVVTPPQPSVAGNVNLQGMYNPGFDRRAMR